MRPPHGVPPPRSENLPAALQSSGAVWSAMDRRHFLSAAFSAADFGPPALCWLSQRADETSAHVGGRRIGRADIDELTALAEQTRHTDSRFGGASAGVSAVAVCLRDVAAPMLKGTYTDTVGKQLFSATAVLGYRAGWADFDTGHHARPAIPGGTPAPSPPRSTSATPRTCPRPRGNRG